MREWHAAYRSAGLTIVGVHTPEFSWERSHQGLLTATRELGIEYPVVQDNDHAIWRRWSTWAWPTAVIVDRAGRIRYRRIGEGAYGEQERVLRALLAER